jgi:peptidoglycan/xylan/chitin deacetylase (PgdA/CDA1 family)
MNKLVTIVMYHYVRELKYSRYPKIKGLDTSLFKEQISYINKNYNVISAYELMHAVESNYNLPERSLLLTFDDAYIDHFTDVFPVLDKYKLPAAFFPPAKCILEHQVLDVNKIHFILSSVSDKKCLVNDIYTFVDQYRSEYSLNTNERYYDICGNKSRYDSLEVVFIKRMLQRELPETLRKIITDNLFKKYISIDESAFSQELYMDIEQISHLQRNGMYIGSHGYDHYHLNSITETKQQEEIDLSLQFLKNIGSDIDRWIMCYPYGKYDSTLLNILENRGCVVGLTTDTDIAHLERDNNLTLPRLDTNDLPKKANSPKNNWTLKAENG